MTIGQTMQKRKALYPKILTDYTALTETSIRDCKESTDSSP